MKFKSKRNHVYLKEMDGRKIVVKQFQQPNDWRREYERYQLLQAAGVKVPEVIYAEPGCLMLSYIEGKTALELLEQQEAQGYFQQEIWSNLSNWLSACADQAGFLMEDMNLGNFIYHEKEACFYGIDFEGDIAEDYAQAVGILLAFIRLCDPQDTKLKKRTCDYLTQRLCKELILEPDILHPRVKEASSMMLRRRQRKKNIQIHETYKQPVLIGSKNVYLYSRDGRMSVGTEVVLKEHLMEVYINSTLTMKLACTPVYLAELVLGRMLTEGMIADAEDVSSIEIHGDGRMAQVKLVDERCSAEKNNVFVETTYTSCTGNHILNNRFAVCRDVLQPVAPIAWRLDWIHAFCDLFHQDMPLHDQTSSTHSCYLSHQGHVCFQCEDIGRHNAVDKVIGYALRYSIDLEHCAVYTTGRMPTDMVTKVIRAGIPILVSKEVPTEDGIALAQQYRLTLIGRAKENQMIVYAGHLAEV